jgi:hypothetical protein
MSVHYREATTAHEIADLLHNRGRIIITAPPRSGKTTELLRYAENRYTNGRFVVVAQQDKHENIINLHWQICNGLTRAEVVAKRLLGQEIQGEDVNPPMLLTPEAVMYRPWRASTALFVDEWFSLSEAAHRVILKHRLFIAATSSREKDNDAEKDQDR